MPEQAKLVCSQVEKFLLAAPKVCLSHWEKKPQPKESIPTAKSGILSILFINSRSKKNQKRKKEKQKGLDEKEKRKTATWTISRVSIQLMKQLAAISISRLTLRKLTLPSAKLHGKPTAVGVADTSMRMTGAGGGAAGPRKDGGRLPFLSPARTAGPNIVSDLVKFRKPERRTRPESPHAGGKVYREATCL